MMENTTNSKANVNSKTFDLDFVNAAANAGVKIRKLIADGKIRRCPTNDKPRSKNGAYAYHSDGWGWFQDWASGAPAEIWAPETGESLTEGEKLERKRKIAKSRQDAQNALDEARKEAALEAESIWITADEAKEHPYLQKKGVLSHGLRVDGETLIIPVIDVNGNWLSLQRINPNGSKFFLADGKVAGGMFIMGKIDPEGVFLLGEGYSTMATCHEATGHPAVVAFNAGNLMETAKALRTKFPKSKIVLCADDDRKTQGNPGMSKAIMAAAAVNGVVAHPKGMEGTDFNDLSSEKGKSEVERIISDAVRTVKEPKMADVNGVSVFPSSALVVNNTPTTKEPIFDRDRRGVIKKTKANVMAALNAMGVTLSYDEFSGEELKDGVRIDDAELHKLRFEVETEFGVTFQSEMFHQAVSVIAREKPFHPVVGYLGSLKWDGVKRLDRMLVDYCGAEDTTFNRVAAAKWMIASVRRVRKPGTLVRNVLIMEGVQGSGKSGFLKVLAVKPEWFLDNLPIHEKSKDTMSQLRGKWIVEFAELSALKKSDVEKAKAFITATEDTDRLAYARRSTTIPRQCILAGTTNQDAYLKDATGGARFWPVKVGKTDFPRLKADLHQLWAEAAHRELSGESHELNSEETELAKAEQDSRFAADPWEELVLEFLADADGEVKDAKVRGETLFNVLGVSKERRTQAQLERLGGILKRLGFERKTVRFGGKLAKGYVVGSGSIEKV